MKIHVFTLINFVFQIDQIHKKSEMIFNRYSETSVKIFNSQQKKLISSSVPVIYLFIFFMLMAKLHKLSFISGESHFQSHFFKSFLPSDKDDGKFRRG